MDDIKSRVRSFFARFFPQVVLEDDQDIFALGFLNSLFAVQLVLFLEKEFTIQLEDEDLDMKNFKSIKDIEHLVVRKRLE